MRNRDNMYPRRDFLNEYYYFITMFKHFKRYNEDEHKVFTDILKTYIMEHKNLNQIQKDVLIKIINDNII